MIEKVKKWCDKYGLLESNEHILLACSGGPDSLALVDIFLQLQPIYELKLSVGHLDHMLRGADSAADADFVENFCHERGLACYRAKAAVADIAKQQSLSVEAAARLARYDFLRKTAAKLGNAKIATGHHRDDQAETILLHLLRGAGSTGIAGIRPQSCGIIRPLLGLSRKDIEVYCRERNLAARIDATNLETCCTRNKIRLLLLPELARTYNPAIKAALCRSGELISEEHDFVCQQAQKAYTKVIVKQSEQQVVIDTAGFNALHLALQREIIRLAIAALQGSLNGFSFYHIEKSINFIAAGRSGALIELPGNLRLERQAGKAELYFVSAASAKEQLPLTAIEVVIPGKTLIPELSKVMETAVIEHYQRPADKNEIIVDLAKVQLPLYLRSRQSGDRFSPIGINGSKKVKDFFIDTKIARGQRDKIPLLCDQQDILWIVGYRQAIKGTVDGKTAKFLTVRFSSINEEGD